MKAETTRRPCLPACASALRMKWTRQRCHEEFRTLAMAAFSPSWASETTSLTPRRPRLASLRRKSVQKVSASVAARLHIGRVQPDIGPFAFERTVEKGRDLAVDLAAQPADLALGDAGHAHRLDQLVDRARGDALDVGFLDHRGERLLRHPAWLQEAWEVAALAQFWDA